MKLIDSHCHVHFNAYKDDMDEVIQRTLEKGVFMITVGTQKDTSVKGLEVAGQHDGMWATIGLHPNHTCKQEFSDDQELSTIKTREERFDMDYFRELAQHPKCVGVGETGLDYYRIPEGLDEAEVKRVQEETVRAHFDLATEADLPVVIHCRDAYEDQARLIQEYLDAGKLQRRGVIHCFTGSLKEAQAFLDQGFYISLSGIVTFAKELMEVAKQIPLDRLLVETDAPYLTPVPHRGKRNEPWMVEYVARVIADLHGVSVEMVSEKTFENTKRVFNLKTA
ncbi:MAG: TatD family hydrolase [bacterium]|jgi:TatD DNase family protein|nr:TatD family hydrolase [bacterium]